MCLRVELIRGWLSHDLVAPSSLRHLTPIFISQAIKRTNTQTHTLQVEWFSCHSRDHLQARLTSTISHIFLHVILDTHTHTLFSYFCILSVKICLSYSAYSAVNAKKKKNPCDYFKQLCSSDAIFRQLTVHAEYLWLELMQWTWMPAPPDDRSKANSNLWDWKINVKVPPVSTWGWSQDTILEDSYVNAQLQP